MTATLTIFVLALIGIGECAYLFFSRMRDREPVCMIGSECHTVLGDVHSKTAGVHNDLLGLIFYGGVAVVTILLLAHAPYATLLADIERFMVIAGVGMSVYFVYLEWRVIRAWCFWCTMSAITTWIMATVLLVAHIR